MKKRQAVDAVFEEYVAQRKPAIVEFVHGNEVYKPKFFDSDQKDDRERELREDEAFGGGTLKGSEGPSSLSYEGKEDELEGDGTSVQADLELETGGLFLSKRPFISKG